MKGNDSNKFFDNAKNRAANILNNREKLKNLLRNSADKLQSIKKGKNSEVFENVNVILRMVKAYRAKDYRDIQWQSILMFVAALVYFVMPVDLLPDFIPITGLVDDFSIIIWVYNQLKFEVDKFIAWENTQNDTIKLN